MARTRINHYNFAVEVALDHITGAERYNVFGRNPDLDTGMEWITEAGGVHVWQTVADTVNLVSTDAADAADGTGWDTVTVHGLDANFNRIQEAVEMSGVTPVTTIQEFLHVDVINAKDGLSVVGSGGVNAGQITATFDGNSNVAAVVDIGDGTSLHLFDIVPNGYRLVVEEFDIESFKTAGGQDPRLDIKLFSQCEGYGVTLIWEGFMDTSVTDQIHIQYVTPIIFESKERWWFEATSDKDNVIVSGDLNGVLVKPSAII